MAQGAVMRDVVCVLRREIARIEGRLAETFDESAEAGETVLRRRNGAPLGGSTLSTGALALDRALGGGLPADALTEIHAAQARDAGCLTGFMLCLATRLAGSGPVLWAAAADACRETGRPYPPGMAELSLACDRLLLVETGRAADLLWIAEEAAGLKGLAAVVVEMRGNPRGLDLTATRRLHRRAQEAGRPVFLLRQACRAGPTAAPARLAVGPAPAARLRVFDGYVPGSIGPPAFAVRVTKSRALPRDPLVLEWNPDAERFAERSVERPAAEDPRALVPPSSDGPHPAAKTGAVVAIGSAAAKASRDLAEGKGRPAHRRVRQEG